MRPRRRLPPTWLVCVAAMMVGLAAPGERLRDPETPYEHRALYIYLIAQYTEWPKELLLDDTAAFVVGILGRDPFRRDLDIIKGEPIKNRKLTVKYPRNVEEAAECQVVYIADSEKDRLPEILSRLERAAVLTFSDLPGFLKQGGMIKLWVEAKDGQEYLRFDINRTAAAKARLRINSQVLRMARTEPAKT